MSGKGRPAGDIPIGTNIELIALGRRILARREELMLTQFQAANLAGVAGSTVWANWERARRCPNALQLARIAKTLQCSADVLLGIESE